ncbi:hypothetical protein, partial [Brucella intermedia]
DKDVSKAFRDSNDSSLALGKKQLAFSQANYDASRDAYARFRLIVVAAIIVALVVALWCAWSLLHAIVGPLNAALAQFDRIAAGDLT